MLLFNKLHHQCIETSSNSPVDSYSQQNQYMDINKKLINRNYLNVKPNHNNSVPVQTLITSSINSDANSNNSNDKNVIKLNDIKRSRSISRSLRSLFLRTSNTDKNSKRDLSIDSHNTHNAVQKDAQSGSHFILFLRIL